MHTVTGIFSTWAEAARAVEMLRVLGFREEAVNVLIPGDNPASVPTDTGEQPGLGTAIGGVTGGAAGAAVGVQVLAGLVAGAIPGVGPVLAAGAIAGLLAGIAGAAVGHVVEDTLTKGVPKDEVALYEEALRRGRSVVFVEAPDAEGAERARKTLHAAGAEALDAARKAWWVGLRDVEKTS